MVENDSKKSQKVALFLYCNLCDYKTCKKIDYTKHLSTDKHKKNKNGSKMVENDSEKSQKVAKYECVCGKIYKYDSGYYRHKKTCKNNKNIDTENKDELILMLVKQNSELIKETTDLKTIMLEVIKSGTHNTTNNTHMNSHNKSFNLNFFLNETCKDAMNIMDFVNSIKLQLSDLEKVGEVGYVEGISNIILKNLKELDITKRPVHCTDKKREVLYIKDEDKWEKDEEKTKMRKVIKKVANKNVCLLPKFKEVHPDCSKSNSKFSDQYNKIIVESMGGSGDNDFEKEEKIIKKIAKEVIIEKDNNL